MSTLSPYATARTGIDRTTGQVLTGWDHCRQSIYVILTTRFNLRVMRLDFGSNVPDLLDNPGNHSTIARAYMAVLRALTKWEPGYKITQFQLVSAAKTGQYTLSLQGIFYPRGHLGDYSISEPQVFTATF